MKRGKSKKRRRLLFPAIQISRRKTEFPDLKKHQDHNLWNGELEDHKNEVSFAGYQFILHKIKCLEWPIHNRLFKADILCEKNFLEKKKEL